MKAQSSQRNRLLTCKIFKFCEKKQFRNHPLKSPQPPFVNGGQGGFLESVWL
jgi:hypothetical protein